MASLTGLRTLYRSCALSRVHALRSAPVVECVNPVAKPLDDRSNKELEDGLQQDEFGPRKTAFAKELLRRREEARGGLKYILVSSIFGVVAFGMALLKRLWRRHGQQAKKSGRQVPTIVSIDYP